MSDYEKITLARVKTKALVDHVLHLLMLHANNAIIVYSPTLAEQIPRSYAANAFSMFQHAMHDYEIVRVCALWDAARRDRESIPSVSWSEQGGLLH